MITLKVNEKEVEDKVGEDTFVESVKVETDKPIGRIGITKKDKTLSKKALKMQKASRKKNRK